LKLNKYKKYLSSTIQDKKNDLGVSRHVNLNQWILMVFFIYFTLKKRHFKIYGFAAL